MDHMCTEATYWKPHCVSVSVCHFLREFFMDTFKCPLQEAFQLYLAKRRKNQFAAGRRLVNDRQNVVR